MRSTRDALSSPYDDCEICDKPKISSERLSVAMWTMGARSFLPPHPRDVEASELVEYLHPDSSVWTPVTNVPPGHGTA